MVPEEARAEVCVLGGGPAGAALARRLALMGHEVLVIERAPFPRPHVGESLPPGILPLLDALGVRDRVEGAGFLRPDRAVVRWAEETDRWKSQPGEPGFQVDRGHFDQLLLRAAREAGARVLQPVAAGRPGRAEEGGWRVPVQQEGVSGLVRARFVADASGRSRWLPGPARRASPPLLALYGYWRDTPLSGPETRVEAGEEAWYWGAPLPDGTFNAAVFLAPEAVRAAGSSVARLYRRLLGESTLLAPCLEGRMERGVLACDASALAAAEPVGPDWIRAGDAAFTIDPLSSQGVQTAIGSALQASIVVHTLLTAPEHASAALEFYRTRCDELARRHTQLAAAHYAERHARRPRPFWKQRSAHPANPAPAPPRAAFPERICPEMRVALSPEASLRGTPCIVDSLVVRRPALHHPGLERPAAYFNGVEIGSLLAPLDGRTQLKRLLMEWGPLMPAPQAWGLAGWLLRAGVLVPVPD